MNKDKQTLKELNKLPIELSDKLYSLYCSLLFVERKPIFIKDVKVAKQNISFTVYLTSDTVVGKINSAIEKLVAVNPSLEFTIKFVVEL